MKKLLLSCLCLFSFFISQELLSTESCNTVYSSLDKFKDKNKLTQCMLHFYENPNFEVECSASFEKSIQIGERLLELNTKNETVYTFLVFLSYSEWVNQKINCQRISSNNDYYRIFRVIEEGIKKFPRSYTFHLESSIQLLHIIDNYQTNALYFAKTVFPSFYKTAQSSEQKILVYKIWGYTLYKARKYEEAKEIYQKVLEIDVRNPVALKMIQKIDEI